MRFQFLIMRILVNVSNLKFGGVAQVADSFISLLDKFNHDFFIVLPKNLSYLKERVNAKNIVFIDYTMLRRLSALLLGWNKFLDECVEKNRIDKVFTLFGPSLWNPKVPHVCGFALLQILYRNSDFYKRTGWKKYIRFIGDELRKRNFSNYCDVLITENCFVSKRLQNVFPKLRIETVTNCCNQIFDNPRQWKEFPLEKFQGVTLLNVSAMNYSHKGLEIIPSVIRELEKKYPYFNFRFVLTHKEKKLKEDRFKDARILYVGNVSVNELPSLYEQSHILFHPTHLECFSASWVEAMKMELPILTSDLDFAHGICGDAACYVDSCDAEAIASFIVRMSEDLELREKLILKGKNQLMAFDSTESRAEKYIQIIESSEYREGR